jgi:UDP:flavonoid glycosyltransferase YjiC (YdhE family)
VRIALLTDGTRGDTQPFIALALRLKAAGHSVILGAKPDFTQVAADYGIEFAPLGEEYKVFLSNNVDAFEAGGFRRLAKRADREADRLLVNLGEAAYEAVKGVDAILFKLTWIAGYTIAEKLGIPSAAVMFFPAHHTREFPAYLIGEGKDRGRWRNRFNWWWSEEYLIWGYQRVYDNVLRTRTLHIPQLPFAGPWERWEQERMPVYYAFSPALQPRPADWPSHLHVTGVWPPPPSLGAGPPAGLVEFLAAGPAPVYVGFGSMPSRAERTLDLVSRALARTGLRAVVTGWWSGFDRWGQVADNLFCLPEVPHGWLFPQVAAVVHHGGSGTTAAGLIAGRPTVVVPFTLDQFSWGRRVHDLGAGPAPVPFSRLTAENLAAALSEATTSTAIQQRAAALGAAIAGEDGVDRTVKLFEEYCAAWRRS